MIPGYLALPDLSAQHNTIHQVLFRNTLYFLPKIMTTVPTINELPSGTAIIYEDTTTNTRRIYMNIGNNIGYLEFKNV